MSIFITGTDGLVWDLQVAQQLQENRIVGQFLGRNGQLPFRLLPEQVKLCVELKLANVVGSRYDKPTANQLAEFNDSKIIEWDDFKLKKAEYERLMKSLFTTGRGHEAKLISRPLAPLINNLESSELPWHSAISKDFDWPITVTDQKRYEIFKYLYHKQLYVGSGSKFGGDYLCYDSRPEDCHAKYIVLVVDDLKPLDLISHARVGTQTKKIFVKARYVNDTVICETIEWTNWA